MHTQVGRDSVVETGETIEYRGEATERERQRRQFKEDLTRNQNGDEHLSFLILKRGFLSFQRGC